MNIFQEKNINYILYTFQNTCRKYVKCDENLIRRSLILQTVTIDMEALLSFLDGLDPEV